MNSLQGAIVGFITALVFNLWYAIGQIVTGSGTEENLPLSIDGCPENQGNFTTDPTFTTISSYASIYDTRYNKFIFS